MKCGMKSRRGTGPIRRMAAAWLLLPVVLCLTAGCKKIYTDAAPLTIGVMPDVDSIPLVMADELGYFKEEKVGVTLQVFRSALERDSALQGGQLDGTISDVLAAVFAVNGGFSVRITSATQGVYRMLAGKGKGIDNVEGIAGRSLGLSKNTIIEYITDRMAEAVGVDPDRIDKIVIKDIPARLEMLGNGQVDLATLPEPLASIAVSQGALSIGSSQSLGINPGVLLFTEKAVRERPDAIAAFYRAYNRAVTYLDNTPRAQYIDLLIEAAGFPETVRDVLALPDYTEAAMVTETEIVRVLDWLADKSLINRRPAPADLTESRFVR